MKKKVKESLRKEPPPGPKYMTSPVTSTASKHLKIIHICYILLVTTTVKEKLFL